MNKLLILILGVILLSCAGPVEKKAPVPEYTIEQFYKNISIGGGSFSADNSKLLVTSNASGIFNVYALPVNGDSMEQLTFSTTGSYFGVSYFPNDDRFLYQADNEGDEISHIYMQVTKDEVVDLTPVAEAKSEFVGWARDNEHFFYVSNARDPNYFDLYEMKIGDFTSKMIYQNNDGLNVAAVSSDKNFLALTKSLTTSNNEMYLYNIKTKEIKHISAHEGNTTFEPQYFDLNGEALYYCTNEGSEFTYLARYDMITGTNSKVWETKWDIWYAYSSYNEKYRVIGVNEDARTTVYVFDMQTGQPIDLPKFEDGEIVSVNISRNEQLMRLTVGQSISPNNIFVYNFGNKEIKKLTNTLNPEIDPANLVPGKVVRYKSFDGTEIPAIYYQPINASPDNKVPALVWVHGGPGGQSRLNYFALVQYLVNHGYAVLAVNNRGSEGYGKTFYQMDDRNHGEGDLQDCIYGKNFLASTGFIDTTKVGIIGGSYGGYMVMAAMTFEPDEFAVGIDLFGVTNWLRTLKSIPPYWESFRQALYAEMGDPTTIDSVRLYNISPLFFAGQVKKPLMVLQGANDPRVLQVESDEIVAAVKANNIPVEYVIFNDEGHGFIKKENEINGYRQIREFLDKHLIGEKPIQ